MQYQVGEKISEGVRKNIFREHRLLQRLDHPNMVSYLGYEERKTENPKFRRAFLYLEYCECGDLHTAHCTPIPRLADSESGSENEGPPSQHTGGKAVPLGDEGVWTIVYYLAAALAYLHYGLTVKSDQRIFEHNWEPSIHRDVKPANGKGGAKEIRFRVDC